MVLVMRSLKHFKLIRLGTIRSDRIGHFIFEAQEQLSIVSDPKIKIWDFYWIRQNTTNRQWRKMICRTLPNHDWIEWVDKWNRKMKGGKIHQRPSTFNNQTDPTGKITNCENKFSFTDEEAKYCKNWLRSKGWLEGQPFACFMVRDSKFLKKDPHYTGLYGEKNGAESIHSYRDCDVKTFLPAMNWLVEKDVFVLRMGKIMKKSLGITNKLIIDYAFDSERSDLLDIWLFANCNYCISTGTGIDAASLVYNRPLLWINMIPFNHGYFTSNLSNSPKKLRFKNSIKYLNLSEHIKHSYWRTDDYKKNGIEIKDLSPDDILEDVQDFYAKHNKTRTLDAHDHARQKAVWKQILTNQKEPILKKKNIHPECDFSYTWLRRQNEEFFQN